MIFVNLLKPEVVLTEHGYPSRGTKIINGKPCQECGASLNGLSIASSFCVDCKPIKKKRQAAYKAKHASEHRDDRNASSRQWTERHPRRKHESSLKYNFDLTVSEYESLLAWQDGKCALCKRDRSIQKYRLAVDHDHVTGRVRGLLCMRCNIALGILGDQPEDFQFILMYMTNACPSNKVTE